MQSIRGTDIMILFEATEQRAPHVVYLSNSRTINVIYLHKFLTYGTTFQRKNVIIPNIYAYHH